MTKIANIRKVELTVDDNHVTYLVRNVGKRAIIIRLKNSGYNYSEEQREKMVVIAAKTAAKLGWKKIVLNYHDDVLKFHNWSSFYCYNFVVWARQAVRLGYVQSIIEQTVVYDIVKPTAENTNEAEDEHECILCAQNIDHGNCDNGF